ncbi:MAG: CrcB family protein [Alphaproteobacteria bacterium]|nr:CrcB family protein [Alphaproteobacteria bacterium]
MTYVAASFGSLIGGSLRWALSELLLMQAGGGFPWGTLFVNVTGSFAIGAYAARAAGHGTLARHFVMTGLCGGYTTFSIFSLETVELFRETGAASALLHVAISLTGWIAAAWLGHRLFRH